MNSLVVLDGEGWEGGLITLIGERVRDLPESGRVAVGTCVKVARYAGDVGMARVIAISDDRAELELYETWPSLALRPIDLVVGLSRPQTIKKVIQAAVMSGVRSLHFVRTESGERSYLDSHILRGDALALEIRKALEQIWQGKFPEIVVHRSFGYFARNKLSDLVRADRMLAVVAHPGGASFDRVSRSRGYDSLVVGIGSEGGWSEGELGELERLGFVRLGLGQRVVRVELAVLYILGQSLLEFE